MLYRLPALILVIILFHSNSFAASKKVKKKPGIVYKKEGYYFVIDKKDKIKISEDMEAAASAAKLKGFIPAEEYFKGLCNAPSNTDLLEPGQSRIFNL